LPQEFGVYPKMPAIDLLEHLAVRRGITHRKELQGIVEGLLQQTICGKAARKRSAGTRKE
jgi:hypothetical protein